MAEVLLQLVEEGKQTRSEALRNAELFREGILRLHRIEEPIGPEYAAKPWQLVADYCAHVTQELEKLIYGEEI